jgi:metal-dependent amidase/aminoacylase/carboxypeptidase family protein
MHGAEYKLEYRLGYPPVVNDPSEAERCRRVAVAKFGAERMHEAPLMMAGEDFSYYLQQVPGCFMFVGAGNAEQGIVHPHHHPRFDIDERSMRTSAGLLLAMAFDYIAGAGGSDSLSE